MDVILARHGETEWSKSGQHTGLTDIPLTENGVIQGKNLGKRLNKKPFALVLCSPLKRAQETCKLSGYFDQAEITEDLYEWDYGEFEGITTKEIRKTHPGWTVFKGPITGGETIEQVSARADRVLERVRKVENGDVILFSSGHFSRVLGARWVGLSAEYGKALALSTASYSLLSYERECPVIKCWNDTSHL